MKQAKKEAARWGMAVAVCLLAAAAMIYFGGREDGPSSAPALDGAFTVNIGGKAYHSGEPITIDLSKEDNGRIGLPIAYEGMDLYFRTEDINRDIIQTDGTVSQLITTPDLGVHLRGKEDAIAIREEVAANLKVYEPGKKQPMAVFPVMLIASGLKRAEVRAQGLLDGLPFDGYRGAFASDVATLPFEMAFDPPEDIALWGAEAEDGTLILTYGMGKKGQKALETEILFGQGFAFLPGEGMAGALKISYLDTLIAARGEEPVFSLQYRLVQEVEGMRYMVKSGAYDLLPTQFGEDVPRDVARLAERTLFMLKATEALNRLDDFAFRSAGIILTYILMILLPPLLGFLDERRPKRWGLQLEIHAGIPLTLSGLSFLGILTSVAMVFFPLLKMIASGSPGRARAPGTYINTYYINGMPIFQWKETVKALSGASSGAFLLTAIAAVLIGGLLWWLGYFLSDYQKK